MRLIFLQLLTWVFCTNIFAQPTQEQRIEDSVIGWGNKLSEKDKPKAYQVGDRTFTVKQQENVNAIIDWVQKSYIPVGGLGSFKRNVYGEKKYTFPHSYGADIRAWNVSFEPEWLDEKGHFKPVDEEYTRHDIYINRIPGSFPIYFLNTPSQYLFTWQPNGYPPQGYSDDMLKKLDPKIHPNVYKYLTWINDFHVVYLVPGNKLPIVAVSIGELLDIVETSADSEFQKEKKKIDQQWQGNNNQKGRENAYKYSQERIDKCINNIRQLRERYKNSLAEPAIIRYMQPDLTSFDGYMDPFSITQLEKQLKQYYPVYKMEPAVMAKCNSDQPQWIAVTFQYASKEMGTKDYEFYRALTEHFNYDYAYDYFFDPEKVKGKPYKPMNEDLLMATLESYRKKSKPNKTTTQVSLPANVHFMDDFMGNSDGNKPAGWFFRSNGKSSAVATVEGKPGKWFQLGYNNPVSPTSLKKPLPENFSLEFDVMTSAFTSRTGGSVRLYLSSYPLKTDGVEDKKAAATVLKFNIISGNEANYSSNYMGNVQIDLQNYPASYSGYPEVGGRLNYELREFTNVKDQVHVTVSKKGTDLAFFINGKKIATNDEFKTARGKPCIDCKLPTDTNFYTLHFECTTDDDENNKVYISNVKVTKN
jgi:hypothetical protein